MNERQLREIDLWIAERIEGWTDIRNDHYYSAEHALWFGRPPRPQPGDSPQDKERGISRIPSYTLDESIAVRLWQPWWIVQSYSGDYRVYRNRDTFRDGDALAVAPTLAQALSLAALEVGIKNQGD